MGKSVDWLDILVRHGGQRVFAHVLGAGATPAGVPAVIIPQQEQQRDPNRRKSTRRADPHGGAPGTAADDADQGVQVVEDGVGDGGDAPIHENGFDHLAPDALLVGYDLGGVPAYDDALRDGRLILEHENTADILARKVMLRLFYPGLSPSDPVPLMNTRENRISAARAGAWLVARYGGQWWVRPRLSTSVQAWQAYEDEAFQAVIGRCLTGFWRAKAGHTIVPLAPTQRMIESVCRAMLNYVYVADDAMPSWLPPSFIPDGANIGLPTWGGRVDFEPRPRQVGRHREVPSFIALQNGVLDVDAVCDPKGARVVVSPPTPRFFNAACLPYDVPVRELETIFGGDEADAADVYGRLCPSWVAFVQSCADAACGEGTEEAAAWVLRAQEIAGYILSQWRELEVLFYFQGARGTGKGTFCEGLQAMIGEAGVASMDADQLASRFGLAALMGRQMYLISELRFDRRFTNIPVFQDRLLKISSGDPVQVEEKLVSTKRTANVRLSGAFVLTLNQEPKWPDDSAAMVRRLVVMPFSKYRGERDDGLKARIAREAAGIFCWALAGLRRLRVDRARAPGAGGGPARFTPLKRADRMVREIEQNMSPATQWADECLVLGPGNECETGLLREHCKAWAKSQGNGWLEEVSAVDFGRMLAAALPGVEREDKVRRPKGGGEPYRVYLGVRPKLAVVRSQFAGQDVVYEEDWAAGGMMPRSVVNRSFSIEDVGSVQVVWPGQEIGKGYADEG